MGTMADDAPLLTPGLRFAKDTSLKARALGWLQRRRTSPPPAASWTLQHTGEQWALMLRSSGPGDLGLISGFANRNLGPADEAQALAWARSVLPDGVNHTINRV